MKSDMKKDTLFLIYFNNLFYNCNEKYCEQGDV